MTGQTASTSTSIRIYRAIKDACMSFSGSTARSKVKEFALFNNQINRVLDGDKNSVRFPAVYVQFENEYSQLSGGRQQINGVFVLHIALQSLNHVDEEVLMFKDELFAHLSFELPKKGFGDFYRSFESQDSDHTSTLVWQQEYSYSYIDDNAADEKKIRKKHPFDIGFDTQY